MARLRSPSGCPWDREQTLETLRPYLIEETYETIEADRAWRLVPTRRGAGRPSIANRFSVQIASEEGQFTIERRLRHINEKLIRPASARLRR